MFGALGSLLGRAANTVNNDVVKPIARDVVQPVNNTLANTKLGVVNNVASPIKRAVVGAAEAINPYDAESRGNQLINQANQRYGFTPQFKGVLDHANPVVYNKSLAHGSNVKSDIAGYNDSANHFAQHGIVVQNNTPQYTNPALLHEGLHSAWQNFTPQQKSDFAKLAQAALPTTMDNIPTDNRGDIHISPRHELQYMLSNYTNYKPGGINDIQSLPEDIQNEIHSYIPEYYSDAKGVPVPPALAKYYSQFYSNMGSGQARQPQAPQPAKQLPTTLARLMGISNG